MRRSLLMVLVIGSCSNLVLATSALAASTSTTTTSTSIATTTTVAKKKPGPVAPLTDLPDPSKVTKHRSALTIKIDNTPQALPHSGVQDADVVYEEIVEGGITRLAAIFNSRIPTVVGPVRSVRRTDREIVFPIGGIFAFSGGAEYAVRSISTAPVKLYTQFNSGAAMFRDLRRPPPHNLFANAALLMAKDGKPRPPPALFTYSSGPRIARGPRVRSFVVGFTEGYAATYTWDSKSRSWDRTIFGAPDVTTNGVRISPKNVIVMSVSYVGGVGVIDSYAQLVGSGPIEVFTNGTLQRGRWSRPNLRTRTTYRNNSGRVIDLTPGQTWVELLDVSENVAVTPASK